jgi:hypothetical protein
MTDGNIAMTPDERSAKLLNIFLPYAARCRERMFRENGRFGQPPLSGPGGMLV